MSVVQGVLSLAVTAVYLTAINCLVIAVASAAFKVAF